jgi:phosphosulfolactate synthase
MNFSLPLNTDRLNKPRVNGVTMVLDKGLSIKETEYFLKNAAPYIDFIKLGWGTAVIIPNLEDKIKLIQSFGVDVYFGGTLFEIFILKNMLKEYISILKKYKLKHVEVSDGTINMKHRDKCDYIKNLALDFTVFSEVGSKDANVEFSIDKWVEMMEYEFAAGAQKLIIEAREAGNVGVYNEKGEVKTDLTEAILNKYSADDILWEAPVKSQQTWFIKKIGANVNLGNITPSEVISLETLRLGLRSDTLLHFHK